MKWLTDDGTEERLYEVINWFVEDPDRADEDPESSHVYEDDAYILALALIAGGHKNPSKIAKDVLVIADMDFSRWYT